MTYQVACHKLCSDDSLRHISAKSFELLIIQGSAVNNWAVSCFAYDYNSQGFVYLEMSTSFQIVSHFSRCDCLYTNFTNVFESEHFSHIPCQKCHDMNFVRHMHLVM